ncbi:hypothetical protein [Halobacterium zhouii]|uniref:hypothetical protein n=1 Tax=Halobacterium zhouii TaxID=2902624 RepID=UPI001E2A3E15|nr:hypothetical protein [Halobacterium zhouii]
MPDTEQLHDTIGRYDSFAELLESADDEQHAHELLSAVEGVGVRIQEVIDTENDELAALEIGWLRLIWEVHHEEETLETLSTDD